MGEERRRYGISGKKGDYGEIGREGEKINEKGKE